MRLSSFPRLSFGFTQCVFQRFLPDSQGQIAAGFFQHTTASSESV